MTLIRDRLVSSIAVIVANFPDKNPPNPIETKKIPIMVLTFLWLDHMVIAAKPTGDNSNSANEMIKYAGSIYNGYKRFESWLK